MPAIGRFAAVVVLTGSVLAGGTTLSAARTQRSAPLPRCSNIQLVITPSSESGAAGHLGVLYRIHNQSATGCSLFGFPGIQLLDRSFHELPTHLQRGGFVLDGRQTPAAVSVPGHGNAWFALLYRDVPANDGSCTVANYLMIFPPNAYLPVVTYAGRVGVGVWACIGEVRVSPVTAGHAGF